VVCQRMASEGEKCSRQTHVATLFIAATVFLMDSHGLLSHLCLWHPLGYSYGSSPLPRVAALSSHAFVSVSSAIAAGDVRIHGLVTDRILQISEFNWLKSQNKNTEC